MADDFAELMELAADLTEAPAEALPFVKKAMRGTAMGIKKAWREDAKVARGEGFSVAYAYSIDFDEKDTANGLEVEIGPNLGKNGGSAGFFEEGASVGAPAKHSGRKAMEANEEDFLRGIAVALYDGTTKAVVK